MMKMDGMKRAAKIMMRGSDLAAVVIDQKSMQELINGKLISSINNVSWDLLKWSYSEPNYAFPDVFSAWSDLDSGFTQLLQKYMEECSRYRKTFKDITAEGKKVTEIQKEKEKSACKVVACRNKVEGAKKAKKTEKHVVNLESELYLAQAKDGEMAEALKNSLTEFELYKAVVLKKSLTKHCHSMMNLLEKSTALCQVKLDVVDSMPSEPALMPVAESNSKVEDIFKKLHLQHPPRDPALQRNRPAQRFKSFPPPQSFNLASHSSQIARHPSESVVSAQSRNKQPMVFNNLSESELSDADDEHDYMTPDEEMLREKMARKEAPKLPPRYMALSSTTEEADCDDMYVVPTLSPSSPKDANSEYFEVVSDEDTPVMPPKYISANSAPRSPRIQVEQKEPESDPIYFVPEDDQGDYDNMGNDKLKEHHRQSVGISPTSTPLFKLRKPAVFPKLFQKAVKDPPQKSPKNSPSPDVNEDDDIYSCVYDEDSPQKSGGSPPIPAARTTLQCPIEETSTVKIKHSYSNMVCDLTPSHEPLFVEETCDANELEVRHTYFNLPRSIDSIKKLAVPAHKPQSVSRKPVAAVRSNIK